MTINLFVQEDRSPSGTGRAQFQPTLAGTPNVATTNTTMVDPKKQAPAHTHWQLWERVGLFDDRYFLIFEDADWCARARDVGAHALVVTRSSVAHAVSASFQASKSTTADYYYIRNGLLYLSEHGEARVRCAIYLVGRMWRASARSFVRDPSSRNARSILAQIKGVADFARRRFGPRESEWRRPRWSVPSKQARA